MLFEAERNARRLADSWGTRRERERESFPNLLESRIH